MKYSFTLCEFFFSISLQQYEIYRSSYKELTEFCNFETCFDLLSHTPDEITKYNILYYRTMSSAISAIIFQAFSVEAYMNFYGAIKLGDNVFKNHYDRISILDKIIIIPRIATGRDFPKGDNIYGLIKKLFKHRDMLVHYKSNAVDTRSTSDLDFCNVLYKCYEFVLDGLDDIINVYPKLKILLSSMEDKKVDLFYEQEQEAMKEMGKLVTEMFYKAFGLEDKY